MLFLLLIETLSSDRFLGFITSHRRSSTYILSACLPYTQKRKEGIVDNIEYISTLAIKEKD